MNTLRITYLLALCLAAVGLISPAHADDNLPWRLKRLLDTQAIKDTAACYGQGHDQIFTDLGGDQEVALTTLRGCFAEDVKSEVVFFGVTTDRMNSLSELVSFIETFAINTNYTSARNVVGNVRVQFTGPHSAIMTSATATPHFIATDDESGQAPTVDVVTARYVDHLERRSRGWVVVRKALIIDEIWRGAGGYPFAP